MAKLKVTQIKSLIGRKKNHRLSVKGLGLKKIGSTKSIVNNAPTKGLIKKINHLIRVEKG